MKTKNYFDNLSALFEEENEEFVDITGSIYRNEKGKVTEIRFFNLQYDEFLVIDREGKVSCTNIDDMKEKEEKKKR